MELSINERAATFIGFVPETCDIELDCPQRVCYRCKRTHRTAPDMSKPENWVRALQVLRPRVDWSLYNTGFDIWLPIGRRSFSANASTGGLAGAIVEGLAALHDAEAGDCP